MPVMPRALSLLVLPVLLAASSLAATPSGAAAAPEARRASDVIPGRYIVTLRSSVTDAAESTRRLERAKGFRSERRYSRALEGFAAPLSAVQVRDLRADPEVAAVVPDRRVRALDTTPLATGDSAPTGVRRVEAATTAAVHGPSSVNVAVIDTGIDLDHPDLAAVDGTNCVGTGPADDDNGHGTHVAGSIAARNDGSGVTGVAPGTRVFAAKALDAAGDGSWSSIICAIDWVTGTRTDADPSNDIAVANMSLGGVGTRVAPCATTTDPLHRAICASTAAGVTYVVAAGNDGWDFDYASTPDVPAAYPEVLTVTATTDSDGTPGAAGSAPACATTERDDVYASFSNFAATSAGAAHTIAAPGTCIRSTWPGGGQATISGTSMATPHVAGAVALCVAEAGEAGPCATLSPSQIVQRMRTDAEAYSTSHTAFGFSGDPARPVSGRWYGYLTRVGIDTTPPTITSVTPANGATGVATSAAVSVSFSEAMDPSARDAFSLTRTSDGGAVPGTATWSGTTLTFRPTAALTQGTSYTATVRSSAADPSGNRLAATRTSSFTTVTNVTLAPGSAVISGGTARSGTVTRLVSDDNAYYELNSTTSGTRTTSWYGRWAAVPNSTVSLRITHGGRHSRTCSQTVSIYRWTTASWVQLDSRSVGTTEVRVDRTVSGTLADFVGGTTGDGEVRVRVACTLGSYSFYSSADLLTLTYGRR